VDEPRPKTILVVEDNAVMLAGLAVVLRRHGYEVLTAENGQQAIDLMRRGDKPDLILLDMLMPVLDGWHFLEQLRQVLLDTTTPVVVATGTNLTQEWAETHGCSGFIRKPFDEAVLLGEVRRCLPVT
jgi:CheY-like chemotaxis protein